ncbi:MAG: tRNA preQ1(34) S-adenosylmethionine ribosyltransferase-isomerase QueA [Candidatus Melainabacteria bacterium HGW-Melainabacteria-1]|nr:MAG: tRNA preQ1(34) S-adenosylmethionine ribosyltransferase-isomerase QueA [Candidatus Melainabacteria bacterium HGW-Melainabacteria-1]
MLLSAYDYELPEALIAQTPAERREASRLMVYRREAGPAHSRFAELGSWLRPGDLLVLNDTQVFPARIFGIKGHTGTRFEFLLARPTQQLDHWRGIAKNSKRIRPGYRFLFGEGVSAEVTATADGGQVELAFEHLPADGFWAWIQRQGEIPYPPYISARDSSPARYQTVYSREAGSLAAPTAGLHFTPELLAELAHQGIENVSLTLHVGLGTFTPVRSERIDAHQMHSELYQLPAATAERLNQQRSKGGRIIAVGTTATRTLETVWRLHGGRFAAAAGETNLFLYPGQAIGAIDGLITNFHLPRSSLLMLVSAWIGREKLFELYRLAIAERYRFYSFGDAMLLI